MFLDSTDGVQGEQQNVYWDIQQSSFYNSSYLGVVEPYKIDSRQCDLLAPAKLLEWQKASKVPVIQPIQKICVASLTADMRSPTLILVS